MEVHDAHINMQTVQVGSGDSTREAVRAMQHGRASKIQLEQACKGVSRHV